MKLFFDTFKRKKKPFTLLILFMAALFVFTCAYSLFNIFMEADFLSGKKYEAQDIEDLYAEKQNGPTIVLSIFFSPLLDILSEFLPGLPSPDILLTETFSVLRC